MSWEIGHLQGRTLPAPPPPPTPEGEDKRLQRENCSGGNQFLSSYSSPFRHARRYVNVCLN